MNNILIFRSKVFEENNRALFFLLEKSFFFAREHVEEYKSFGSQLRLDVRKSLTEESHLAPCVSGGNKQSCILGNGLKHTRCVNISMNRNGRWRSQKKCRYFVC